MEDIAASLQGTAFDNLNAKLIQVPIHKIQTYKKDQLRKIDSKEVEEMEKSIELIGLREPIALADGVHTDDFHYRVIFGNVRFVAWRNKYSAAMDRLDDARKASKGIKEAEVEVGRWTMIPAFVYPKTLNADFARLIAIEENATRGELTKTIHQKFKGEVAILRTKLRDAEAPDPEKPKPKRKHDPETWLKTFCDDRTAGAVAVSTGNRWWKEYREASGVKHTPAKATDKEIDGFFKFLIKKEEADKEAAEAEADNKAKAEIEKRNALIADWAEKLSAFREDDEEAYKEAITLSWTGSRVDFRE